MFSYAVLHQVHLSDSRNKVFKKVFKTVFLWRAPNSEWNDGIICPNWPRGAWDMAIQKNCILKTRLYGDTAQKMELQQETRQRWHDTAQKWRGGGFPFGVFWERAQMWKENSKDVGCAIFCVLHFSIFHKILAMFSGRFDWN